MVDDFIAEAKAKKVRTLEELNRYWTYYLEEYYQVQPHDGIKEYYESRGLSIPDAGISPKSEWNRDSRKLVFLDASRVGEAFLHHEERVVDKGGCITFQGSLYEVSSALIGATVTISYDPMSTDELTVHYKDMDPLKVTKTAIRSYCDRKPEVPASMLPVEPETSRMLDVLEKRHKARQAKMADAISFGAYRKEGD